MVIEYDSDSTEGDFTETNVLLGYVSQDAADETISKLGGRPDWLDAAKPPSAALARCKACRDLMALLLQLNGELPERFPTHERRLYVLACRRKTCRRKEGSVRVLRGVRLWEEESAGVDAEQLAGSREDPRESSDRGGKGSGLGEALFGKSSWTAGENGPNPFSKPTTAMPNNPFNSPSADPPASLTTHSETRTDKSSSLTKTFAESLILNGQTNAVCSAPSPPEPWPAENAQPRPFRTLYLSDADYETLDPTSPSSLPADTRLEAADAPEPSVLDREAFESTMDATFQKFADRLDQNPEQVIRYGFTGQPLLYSRSDGVGSRLTMGSGMPPCGNCGARRVFEVQLTPHAIAELEAEELSLEGMEWGTIIVGVCEKDCVPKHTELRETAYLEEWAGVQWEELTK